MSGDKVEQAFDVAKADGCRRRISPDQITPRIIGDVIVIVVVVVVVVIVVIAPEEELLEAILGDQEVGDRLFA